METAAKRAPPTSLDRNHAQAEWLLSLPPEVRDGLLRPRDLARLLAWSEQFLRRDSAEGLAQLGAEAYRLARRIVEEMGHEATLRYLRDGLIRALAPCVRTSPECAELVGRIIARVSDAAWEAHADTLQETIQRQQSERLLHELTLAKRIQQRLLPRTIPQIPGWDIAGKVLQAAEVGGDYWSCKSYPEDEVVTLKLADVTGHGIAAATLVAAVKFISGGYYRGAKSPAEVMEQTNRVLVKETPHDIMVTMVYAWLYPHSGELSVVNAGHSPVLHYQGGKFRRVEPTGYALGLMETGYTEVRLTLESGDLFFTCSDGITEPSAEAALGEAWVREQVKASAHLSAAAMVEHILDEALKTYKVPQDDMSVLVVKRTG
jgi:hypothetical protein